jgi:hypothetical protein
MTCRSIISSHLCQPVWSPRNHTRGWSRAAARQRRNSTKWSNKLLPAVFDDETRLVFSPKHLSIMIWTCVKDCRTNRPNYVQEKEFLQHSLPQTAGNPCRPRRRFIAFLGLGALNYFWTKMANDCDPSHWTVHVCSSIEYLRLGDETHSGFCWLDRKESVANSKL